MSLDFAAAPKRTVREADLLHARRLPLLYQHRIAVVAVAGGLVVTMLTLFAGEEAIRYRSATLHTALETTSGLSALLAAYLVFGRYRYRARADDLVAALALAILAATNLVFAVPTSPSSSGAARFVTWVPLLWSSLGTMLLAAAPFTPTRKINRRAVAGRLCAAAVAGALAGAALAVTLLDRWLPLPVDADLSPPADPALFGPGPASILVWLCVLALLLAVAAVGFSRRQARAGDELTRWLAAACALGVFARLDYVIFPSMHSNWIYSGDLLRLGAYLFCLTGAVREISLYQRQVAEAAVAEERRRLARDLHDDVSQDLAYIALRVRQVRPVDGQLDEVIAAAERALAASRSAIAALAAGAESLERALTDTAAHVAAMTGVAVQVEVDSGLDADAPTVIALTRVAREAALNAARHGRAEEVIVQVTGESGIRLTVRDDGTGFDPDTARSHSSAFGLISMRERIERIGGSLSISSRPGEGSVVEAVIP